MRSGVGFVRNNDSIRVLIVDDDQVDAELAVRALRMSQDCMFEVETASELQQAHALLDSQAFDIMLLDLGLFESQGIETLKNFRAKNKMIPLIVLSGLEDEDFAIEVLEHDAQDYIFKSDITSQSLAKSIRYVISRQQSLLENRRLVASLRENELVLKRKNERLAKLFETAQSFVDNVSHEFRTPLTVIKEYVSLIRDETLGSINDDQRRFLNIAEDRADDLNTMVDDMLDVSKLEAGLLGVYRHPCDLKAIVDRVLPSLNRKSFVKDISLDVDIPSDLPEIFCDPEKIQRVLMNLSTNAMKFCSAKGNVRISATHEPVENQVRISVSDDGPGIAEEDLRVIFDRFKQVGTEVRSSTKGFGLGLSIAKELVDLNLGEMSVTSRIGEGSTFSFTVPRSEPAEIIHRYILLLSQMRADEVDISITEATIDDQLTNEEADELGTFLSYVLRGYDLVFRADVHRWILVVPESETENMLFLERIEKELAKINRNRPRGPLPPLHLKFNGCWTNVKICEEELVSRVRMLLDTKEPGYV